MNVSIPSHALFLTHNNIQVVFWISQLPLFDRVLNHQLFIQQSCCSKHSIYVIVFEGDMVSFRHFIRHCPKHSSVVACKDRITFCFLSPVLAEFTCLKMLFVFPARDAGSLIDKNKHLEIGDIRLGISRQR